MLTELCSKAISICQQDEETSANEESAQQITPKGGRGKRKAGGDRYVESPTIERSRRFLLYFSASGT